MPVYSIYRVVLPRRPQLRVSSMLFQEWRSSTNSNKKLNAAGARRSSTSEVLRDYVVDQALDV